MEIKISNETNRRTGASGSSRSGSSARRPSGNARPAQRSAGTRSSSAQRSNAARSSAQRTGTQQRTANGQRPAQRPAGQPQRRKKKRGISPVIIVLIVALVIAIGVFAGIGAYTLKYVNYDKILPNVYVNGIDVGGMTIEEATAAIETLQEDTVQNSVNVILPDQTLTFTPAQDTVLINVDEAVNAAYAYGRASSNPFAISRAIKAAQRRRNDIDISTAITIDTDYIQNLIDTTAQSVETAMVDSTTVVDEENRTVTVTIGSAGRSLDTDELYSLVSNAFTTGDYSDIEFNYTMEYPALVTLDTIYAQLSSDPTDAYYDKDTDSVIAGTVGYVPDVTLEEANEQLAMASAGDVLTFSFSETNPEITSADLEAVLFSDTLYSYGSTYASNSSRTTNLKLACQAIDGTILEPGEVFSFNDTVGERTAEKGYKEATVYVSGDSVPALGGGICQVASTIYTCCMYSDLDIVYREPHMYFVTYVPGGLDATVYWGSVDFQFKNSTDYPLKIEAGLSNGKCNIRLVGTDVNNYTIKIDSECTNTNPYSTVTKEGTGDNVSGYTGYTYQITRYVYDASGTLIRTDSPADLDTMGGNGPGLGTSVYEKRDKVTYTGQVSTTTPTPSPSPSEEPSPSPSPTTTTTPTPTADPSTPTPAPATPTPEPATPTPAPATPTPAPIVDPEPVADPT